MNVTRIAPDEAHRRLADEGYLYLDVRSVPEFEQGHPAGAYNVPLMHLAGGRMTPNPDFLDVVLRRFAKDARIVVGCKSGGRSLQAANLLAQHGYTNVVDMRGGYGGEVDRGGQIAQAGWAACALPTATAAEPGRSYQELRAS